MTVYLVMSLPWIPCIHCVYTALANAVHHIEQWLWQIVTDAQAEVDLQVCSMYVEMDCKTCALRKECQGC
jgi:hypothetical protein